LDATEPVGLETPLVDQEGFPRADLDVYEIRHARAKFISFRNDYKNIMKEIEESLQVFHSSRRDDHQDSKNDPAFAVIESVAEGSPAFIAGLNRGDFLIRYSSYCVYIQIWFRKRF